MTVFQWPVARQKFTSGPFRIKTASLGSRSSFTPVRSTSLISQFWVCSLVYAPTVGTSSWQDVDAFFARIEGDVHTLRIGDPLRGMPKFNRTNAPAVESWSDNTNWSDGTGWLSGMIPPTAQLAAAASRGDSYIHIEGLPETTAAALAAGDLLELRPAGIATETGNLYQVVVGGATDANGEIGIEVRPRLRQNFAAGDMVVFLKPQTVMRLADSDQGIIEREANVGTFGFSCVEHLG
jgi:hypothetical protein